MDGSNKMASVSAGAEFMPRLRVLLDRQALA
jgi:hypothetical protein